MKRLDYSMAIELLVTSRIHEENNTYKLAKAILADVFQFRRMVNSHDCSNTCPKCQAPHMNKVVDAINENRPITFILPAFPGKSPNTNKVLGHLPDMAEREALKFLNQLCKRVKKIYAPGAKMVICSDGRVFSDVVGIKEEHISEYQIVIDQIIEESNLEDISTFNLDDLCESKSFDLLREELMDLYGQEVESLRAKVKRGGKGSLEPEDIEANRMYCGLTRFLFEDAMTPGQTKSRSSIQKESRAKAYEVIRRSNAWTELIAEVFPHGVRLSIHPQGCGSQKLGIQLLGVQTWMTPWHGVAVDNGSEFVLMKRWEAEELGAKLIIDANGNASHFQIREH